MEKDALEMETTDTDGDVVVVMKQFMRSQKLSQQPAVVLPAGWAKHLRKLQGEVQPLPRNSFSSRQLQEFRKTADRVECHPWLLTRAASYLRQLRKENEEGHFRALPPILSFVTQEQWDRINGGGGACPTEVPNEEWADFAPGTPRVVRVSEVKTRTKGTKRPTPETDEGEETSSRRGGRGCRGRGSGAAEEAPGEASVTSSGRGGRGGRGRGAHRGVNNPAEEAADQVAEVIEEYGEEVEVEGEAFIYAENPQEEDPPPLPEAAPVAVRAKRRARKPLLWESQSSLGCSKCRKREQGCSRCKKFHEKWKQRQAEQQGREQE